MFHVGCQGHGALKASLIDVLTSDKEIEQSLSSTLHKPLEPLPEPELGDDVIPDMRTCFPFLCQNDANFTMVDKLVQKLGREISDRKLHTGMLLLFSSSQSTECAACLLGVVMHKPRLQMLVEAHVIDGEATEVQLVMQNGRPRIYTSHNSS